MVDGEVAEHSALNLDFLGIHLPFYLVARLKLFVGEDACALEHLDALGAFVGVIHAGCGGLYVEPAACCLLFPFVAISVAVEVDGSGVLDEFAHFCKYGVLHLLTFRHACGHFVGEDVELVCYGGVEGYHG